MTQHHTPEFEFIALVALLTALVAMSIDTMLPALGIMAHELNAAHENDRQFIILGFFAGLTFGTLVFGPISDSLGRKSPIVAGLALYIIGALLCFFATSFPMLIIGRVLQGFGAAGPRIVSMAMVRDNAGGAAMARIMSFVMSIFMLVPILAPSIGQVVLFIGSWRLIFGGFVVAAIIAGIWLGTRQEETLPLEKRHPFKASELVASALEVVKNPVSLGYTMAVGAIFGAFTCYLGTSQQIFAEQYHQGERFALWFGGLAVAIAVAMIFNGRNVVRLGMRKISKWALRGFIITWALVLALCFIFAGQPPLVVIGPMFFVSFFCSGLLFGNYNALAMEPMGHIAGMAAAVTGALSSLIALVFGGMAGRTYDGTLFPLAYAFLGFGLLALVFSEWAERNRKPGTGSVPIMDAGHF
ncbi:multidrug effflux MFS transporter [Aestuariivirga litoralis]|uniref:multidrug effflux MFS transporter n=1 Tax=Aestuariivirga litoralis TaxID=2650924 RepID=UPI0018C7AB9E|nr:multidrug effflux MFS transporter [Aestuariivirga litoralis]MBG1232260.1 multidrug effflux MFS transporter [Aestuariivirga litoralis]